ncbi:hypothetical protein H257_09790 [Aphanomyces astaci]|uniref:Uncharacterized protein n=1 Tax=Aphanomyces astaci TaxID=112090 RepID=W4G9E4_APHAT|nr:hypothetical protein H257_09790 [Aphanomyces astaci]ETV76327.1 hypothetical protein H257_09790 [Aphanomyces astaci]|eukprot:XP_009834452.1 hypothetical protein H257_09790 [Aphanomyces astaci]
MTCIKDEPPVLDIVQEEAMLAKMQDVEDREIVRLTRELEACKDEIGSLTQDCVEMGSGEMQCQRTHQEMLAEMRIIEQQIDTLTTQLAMAPSLACMTDVETFAGAIVEFTNRPKQLHQELTAIKRRKHDLQQQILVQQKNIHALEKLSAGQASRVDTLERDIADFEGILHDTEEGTHHLRQSYQVLMHQIHRHREQVSKPSKEKHRNQATNPPRHPPVRTSTESLPATETPVGKPRRDSKAAPIQTAADLIQSFQKRRYTSSKRQKTLLEY